MKLPPVLVYTVLRLLAFFVPLGLFMLLPIFRQNWVLAVLFAAIIGLALSILFLRRPLDAVTEEIAERRARRVREDRQRDEDVEDADADAAAAESHADRSAEGAASDVRDASADERPGEQR
ncbi:DUF4229 domain-containing protein [Microbacterium sp. LRZ72]|uniref:DUF4229 domain-containing protein n=1 Tax=Microbacterium sp. LRZ72 TaxID=2942481 RepID=UPI0029A8DECE|nr:DUF4229 domain-containing protein [Microbacterium sp. LRZ72]MDX2377318.1 DUF4229 domain-containing protein [Microbacterium sp. LRZ72]